MSRNSFSAIDVVCGGAVSCQPGSKTAIHGSAVTLQSALAAVHRSRETNTILHLA